MCDEYDDYVYSATNIRTDMTTCCFIEDEKLNVYRKLSTLLPYLEVNNITEMRAIVKTDSSTFHIVDDLLVRTLR